METKLLLINYIQEYLIMINTEEDDIKIKLMRLRHEIRLDKMKMLQDIELPLAVKKLKLERNKKYETIKTVEPEKIEDQTNE